jgi:hypothetical protein
MYVNYNKVTDWTKDKILYMLSTNDAWVEQAIIMLYKRQTEDEKMVDVTVYDNDNGFQVADCREFGRYARKLLAGGHLSQMELASARRPWHRGKTPIPTIAKYRGQILEMIEANAKAKLRLQAR